MDYLHNQVVQLTYSLLGFLDLDDVNETLLYKSNILHVLYLGITHHLVKWVNKFVIKMKRKETFDDV